MKFRIETTGLIFNSDMLQIRFSHEIKMKTKIVRQEFWRYLYFLKKIQMFSTPSKFQSSETGGGERMLYRNLLPQKYFRIRAGPGREVFFGTGPGREKIFRAGRAATKISGPGRPGPLLKIYYGPGRATLNCHGPGRVGPTSSKGRPGRPGRPGSDLWF